MRSKFRQTKVIFTVGPKTDSEEMLKKLILEGVDICRINMAHANHESTREIVRRVRKVSAGLKQDIAIMMDIKGPEIRTGVLEHPLDIDEGDLLDIMFEGEEMKQRDDDVRVVGLNYPEFKADIKIGDTVLVDNGLLRFEVVEKEGLYVRCKVLTKGILGSRRHINLPGVRVSLPSLTMKDRNDVQVAIEEGIDFIALSFVREADDLDLLRRYLTENDSTAKIIAKVEEQQGLSNLHDIIVASDGVMVARGDLGIECPLEDLPIIQHKTIKHCILEGKPVIVATHLLESMIHHPVPTRAEVSDVSNAVFEQSDCIMLSGETTTGKYPLECVQMLNKIIRRMETQMTPRLTKELKLKQPKAKMLRSAAVLAMELENAAIVIFTRSGYLPQLISSLRPNKVPIFAFTDVPNLYQQMNLLWGIEPFFMEFSSNPEETIHNAIKMLKGKSWAADGDYLVTMTNVFTGSKTIESIQLRQIED